ncbi:MAG: hypothetical protein KF893_24930 [Caldilineaceae bacterium]|nr:hypothetical protein [Caldilineaceae bacterium]
MDPIMAELLAHERWAERERELQEIQHLRALLPQNKKNPLLRQMIHAIGVQLVRIGTKLQAQERVEQAAIPVHNCP